MHNSASPLASLEEAVLGEPQREPLSPRIWDDLVGVAWEIGFHGHPELLSPRSPYSQDLLSTSLHPLVRDLLLEEFPGGEVATTLIRGVLSAWQEGTDTLSFFDPQALPTLSPIYLLMQENSFASTLRVALLACEALLAQDTAGALGYLAEELGDEYLLRHVLRDVCGLDTAALKLCVPAILEGVFPTMILDALKIQEWAVQEDLLTPTLESFLPRIMEAPKPFRTCTFWHLHRRLCALRFSPEVTLLTYDLLLGRGVDATLPLLLGSAWALRDLPVALQEVAHRLISEEVPPETAAEMARLLA